MTQHRPSKTKAPEPKPARNVVKVSLRDFADTPDAATARMLTQPAVQAATAIQKFEDDNHEVNALIRELELQAAKVHSGDLGRPEAMLLAQAQALDEVFYSFVRRSHANMENGYPDACDRYMRLALKAQPQSRTTLETLAEIKNPRPVAFVRQANIAHGHQQVNNGAPAEDGLARETFEKQSNKLSGERHELLPDARASQAESRIDTPLEAVGEVHRAAHFGRQSKERPE